MIEVKGEYGRASSTVGGGLRIGRPPPLILCQLPFIAVSLVQLTWRRGTASKCQFVVRMVDVSGLFVILSFGRASSRQPVLHSKCPSCKQAMRSGRRTVVVCNR